MANEEDSTDLPEDTIIEQHRAYRARLLEKAQNICGSYRLRDPTLLEDRLNVAIGQIREADRGEFFMSDREYGDIGTDKDKSDILNLKAEAARLYNLLTNGRRLAHFSAEAQTLKTSLKDYLSYLDTVTFNRKDDNRGAPLLNERFLVYRIGQYWHEISGCKASAWQNKKKGRPSKFYMVIKELCEWLGRNPPSESSVERWLKEGSSKNWPLDAHF
jgi:hypothetical protein